MDPLSVAASVVTIVNITQQLLRLQRRHHNLELEIPRLVSRRIVAIIQEESALFVEETRRAVELIEKRPASI